MTTAAITSISETTTTTETSVCYRVFSGNPIQRYKQSGQGN